MLHTYIYTLTSTSTTEFLLIGLPAELSKISDPSLLMSLLLQLNLFVILALFLILLSQCLILSTQFLYLASYLFAIFEGLETLSTIPLRAPLQPLSFTPNLITATPSFLTFLNPNSVVSNSF